MAGYLEINSSLEFFPLKDFKIRFIAKVLEQPGLPVKNKGILFIKQQYMIKIFSFNALFLAIFLGGSILSIKSFYSLSII